MSGEKYRVVTSNRVEDLEAVVNALMSVGWSPQGAIAISTVIVYEQDERKGDSTYHTETTFAQAMVIA